MNNEHGHDSFPTIHILVLLLLLVLMHWSLHLKPVGVNTIILILSSHNSQDSFAYKDSSRSFFILTI
jgi:hypothetical protein